MANFIVRIELHDADSDDYDSLHKKMEAKGFSKTITSDEGITYKLPDAEYEYESNETASDVLQKAYSIAESVRKKPSVLVTESEVIHWKGLKRA
ncbi:type V toxin-antitoxin system endoribonuclease antitoxin GhoS [Photorhabdus cinerea]|uniref:DUF2622 domain-containing protein n=1 Tax=Photorhabdus cinerea TaxID=471575 RepID=A0A7X5TJA8_9GAMM|nr:type V toxin-antitoxin system endoribonuclease antitoxin GhoS [Photorhabdus cinerea]NHB94775.1 DUF2622 domain-containing protein [Photorhabdus cinerea]